MPLNVLRSMSELGIISSIRLLLKLGRSRAKLRKEGKEVDSRCHLERRLPRCGEAETRMSFGALLLKSLRFKAQAGGPGLLV